MKRFRFLLLASFMILTVSCSKTKAADDLMLDSSQKQVIFFTDESDYQNEAPYYDAIIELRKEFPDEMKKMKVMTAAKAKKYYNTFGIKGCPAILVLHQNRIAAKVNGDVSKDKIIEALSKALGTDT
jgi:hypothetical protein